MFIKVLGSAAGGGFPQANCNCRNCRDVRAGRPGLRARTQSSLAVSRDGRTWVLINASPDLRQQIAATPELLPPPEAGVRGSPIEAVVLTSAEVDHVAGLLSLREGIPFTLYAARPVLEALAANPIFGALDARHVARVALATGGHDALNGAEVIPGLTIAAFPVPGKVALYLEDPAAAPDLGALGGETIGLEIRDRAAGASFFYIPGCARMDAALAERLRGARLVLFDGTLYSDEEMIAQGLSSKTGARMGHIAMAGPAGSIAAFRELGVERRIFVHINNSNPVLLEDAPERAAVENAGWEIAFDGMELVL